MTTIDLLKKTKAAWGSIRSANAEEKNRLLLAMAESLEANQADILRENQKDMDAARGSISDVMLDRLALTQARIHAMADGIREAAALEVGAVAKILGSAAFSQQLLETFVNLLKDNNTEVKKNAIKQLTPLSAVLPRDAFLSKLFPFISTLATDTNAAIT